MDKKLLVTTFRNVTLATVYVFGISQIMQNGEKLFGGEGILVPFIILLLFSLSAAVVGGLVLGQAIFLFFDDKKKQSVLSAIYSVSWLGFYTILFLVLTYFLNK